ncbi:MAG: hypothetical protein PSV35_04885, partial [bacterium]|nr:hypothetical protein [bacterium]
NEMRIVAMEKILQKKTHRFVENLLIDAAIAGHKTAHQHIKLVELNCQDGVKLKMVKRFSTIEEMKMLVWDLQKYGASSTYYWLNNPQQVNDLQQGLRRLIDAHEQRCETEQMLKASQRVLSEVDLRKLTSPDDDEEVNEEIANLALSQSSVMIERSETAAEASQPPVLSPAESSQRPRSMF